MAPIINVPTEYFVDNVVLALPMPQIRRVGQRDKTPICKNDTAPAIQAGAVNVKTPKRA